MSEKAEWGDVLELDYESTLDDSEGQRLWIRVGPVYTGQGESPIPGIWLSYQEKSLASPLQGPVLISPSNWEKLKQHIDTELASFDSDDYGQEQTE